MLGEVVCPDRLIVLESLETGLLIMEIGKGLDCMGTDDNLIDGKTNDGIHCNIPKRRP